MRAPLVTVTTAGADVAETVILGTTTVRGPVEERVGRDKMLGMVTERPPLLLLLPLLLVKELRLEVKLGEEVLEMVLELGEEVLELLLLDEEELLELELDEELLDEDAVLELGLELELGEVATVLVEGRLGTLLDKPTGALLPPVHTPLQATIWPLTH